MGKTLSRAWQNLRANLRSGPAPAIQAVPPQPEKEWAVLVYSEGHQGLAYASQQALQQLQSAPNDQLHLAMYQEQRPTWKEKLLPQMGPPFQRTFQVEGPQAQVVGEGRRSLGEFVAWGMQQFPAKHYAVVVKRHGLGFLDSEELRKQLETAQRQTGKKPDLIALDSCLMQQAEVAYELRQQAEVLVAGPNNVSANAFPYSRMTHWLQQHGPQIDAERLGRLLVEGHRMQGGESIQSATKLRSMETLAGSVRNLTDNIFAEKVPPELVYTSMMQVPSIEGQDVRHIAFDYRDLSSFVQNLATHPSLQSEKVQQACFEVYQSVEDSLIGHHVRGPHATWNNARGFTTYMPWQKPDADTQNRHQKLAYTQDSGWGKLLDYARQAAPQAAPKPAAPSLSMTHLVSKSALYAYKKYISPYLGKACTMTPSCSAYARQAIETHGLWEGIKFSTVRLCSCNGSFCGCHPVPGARVTDAVKDNPAVPLTPAPSTPGPVRAQLTGGLARLAGLAGKVAGGLVGAALAGPAGMAAGALLGYQAGAGKLDAFNDRLFERYQPPSQEAFMEVEVPLVRTPIRWQQSLQGTWAAPLSGILGAVAGTATGLVGGIAVGLSWGQKFGGLLGENATRDAFGELPPNPLVEQSLSGEHSLQTREGR